jgi:RNA polymerase sigma-70 factor (sigma-E family)
LEDFVSERGKALLATAALLAGGRQEGEDLLQEGLERLLRHWPRIKGDPEGYLRRTLYNLAVDRWRRRRRMILAAVEPAPVPDASNHLTLRSALVAALAQLPPKQRVTLVLRYWEQLSEKETANMLGCSAGTVKSNTARGLARMRELTQDWWAEETTSIMGGIR